MHPGQQDDQPLGGVVQPAEQACAQAVLERQDRRGLDPAAGQRRGRVGEQVRRAFSVLNSDRIADRASSRVAPVSGASWPVRSSG